MGRRIQRGRTSERIIKCKWPIAVDFVPSAFGAIGLKVYIYSQTHMYMYDADM